MDEDAIASSSRQPGREISAEATRGALGDVAPNQKAPGPISAGLKLADLKPSYQSMTAGFRLADLKPSYQSMTAGFRLADLKPSYRSMTAGFRLADLKPSYRSMTAGLKLADTMLDYRRTLTAGFRLADLKPDYDIAAGLISLLDLNETRWPYLVSSTAGSGLWTAQEGESARVEETALLGSGRAQLAELVQQYGLAAVIFVLVSEELLELYLSRPGLLHVGLDLIGMLAIARWTACQAMRLNRIRGLPGSVQ